MLKPYYLPRKCLMVLLLLLSGSAPLFSQTVSAARQQQGGPAAGMLQLRDALIQLKERYQVDILFEESVLQGLSVEASTVESRKTVEENLRRLLKPFGLKYQKLKRGAYLIVPAKSAVPEASLPDTALPATTAENAAPAAQGVPSAFAVSGRVTDEKGEGLPGVTVVLKGTTTGTTTDGGGNYRLELPDGTGTLVFSFIGYVAEEVAVGGRSTVDMRLVADIKSLGEVVVVGYGERKKTTYTGSVASIDTKEIVQAPVADLSNNLVGRLTGVIATQRTGEPGADGSGILIRGVSTTGSNAPLIVVDGIPRSDYGFSQIDPNEIESLSVLKDAAAASVFGVRGANGVILITTKRGKRGKPQFSLSTRMDFQTPTRLPKYLDSYNMAKLYNEALVNEGKPELYSQQVLDNYRNGTDPDLYPNTDWFAATLDRFAPQSQHNLNVSGGTDQVRYFFSAGYLNQKGLYENLNYKRYNIRSNIDVSVTKTTTVRLDLAGRLEDRNTPGISSGGIFDVLTRRKPTVVEVYSNGLPAGSMRNAIANSGYGQDDRNVFQSLLSVEQQVPFVPGLSVRGQLAYDRLFRTTKNWNTPYLTYGYDLNTDTYIPSRNGTTSLFQYFEQNQSLTAEAHLNYLKRFGRHNVSGLLLYTQTDFDYNDMAGGRTGFISTAIDQLNVGGASNQPVVTGGADERARRGVVGRVSYDFDTRYLLEASFRYDGSENFPRNSRWGFFPSVSAGWRLSEEVFFKDNVNFVNNLKIRASVGQLGNDVLLDENGGSKRFAYLSGYSFANPYVINGTLVETLQEGRLANPNITWEKATSSNIGLEGSLWGNKLSFELDYFYKLTTGILGRRILAVPVSSGIGALPFENLDKVSNRGVEAVLGHNNQIGGLTYFVRGNLTYVRNRVEFKAEPENIDPNIRQTGRSIGQYFGYQALGLFQSQEEITNAPDHGPNVKPGDIRYADLNEDKKIDDKDRTAIGFSNIPQLIYGLSLGASMKGVSLSVLLQGAGRVSAYTSNEIAWAFFNGGKATEEHLDRWTPDNPGATYPRIATDPTGNNVRYSSYWLRDASYLRLKNLELAYDLPAALLQRIKVRQVRVFVLGQNLLTFDRLKIVDPEGPGASGNAGRGWFYPQMKTYSAGLNVGF